MGLAHSNKLLELVSRSFALCIPRLPMAVRPEVENFYLLCRFADSIEDSKLQASQKEPHFSRLYRTLKKEDPAELERLSDDLLPFIFDRHDYLLIQEFQGVLEDFSAMQPRSKKIALKWLKEMMKGMNEYSQKEIKTFLDLNKYCYYVAGTVGHYLTDVFIFKFRLKEKKALKKRAQEFGLLLQKVNIIRDFSKDFSQGRIFWPKQLFEKYGLSASDVFDEQNGEKRAMILDEMVQNANQHVQPAVEYVQRLPTELRELRLSCAIPLGLAVPTLAKCTRNPEVFERDKKVKLSRTETFQIIHYLDKNINSDDFLPESGATPMAP